MNRTLWPKASPDRVRKALDAHSVTALVTGAFIYILCVTGTLAVFNPEFQQWEQPGIPEMETLPPEAAAEGAKQVLAADRTPTTHLFIKLPSAENRRAVITTDHSAYFVDSDGQIAGKEDHPWTQSVLDLHYYLHLPEILGLTVVGLLGVMLLSLILTGLLAHPRILRDAFRLRGGAGRVTHIDLHNRLSVWGAPFHIAIALTGATIGLATLMAVAIAGKNFDGDVEAVFAPVFGDEPAPNPQPAVLADISNPLAHMTENHPEITVSYVIVHDPQTAGQHVTLIGLHPGRLIFGEYYNFDAAGQFLGTTGLADGTPAQQMAASMYQVHFGHFGGLPVRIAYGLLGLALCTIIISGMKIYFVKRTEKGRASPIWQGAWRGVAWGVPGTLALMFLISLFGDPTLSTLNILFWSGSAVAVSTGALCASVSSKKTIRHSRAGQDNQRP